MGECPCWSDEHVIVDGIPVCARCHRQKCPTCEGAGEVAKGFSMQSRDLYPVIVKCPACNGTGAYRDQS